MECMTINKHYQARLALTKLLQELTKNFSKAFFFTCSGKKRGRERVVVGCSGLVVKQAVAESATLLRLPRANLAL